MNGLIKNSDFGNFVRRFFGDNDFSYNIFPSFNTLGHSNIMDKENEFVVEMAVPGVKKEDIKIDLENDTLTISSLVKNEKVEENDSYYRKEFHKGEFERSFTIPKIVDKTNVSAKMEDGILIITLPKLKPEEKPDQSKTIKID